MRGSTRSLDYRPDIDGVRALAVLSVIGFHAAPQFVPGGFVGVDVFYVISGFLISAQLLDHLYAGTFSFADFYARRIRRIFPALIVVLLACSWIGWYTLLEPEYATLKKDLAAAGTFTTNIVLWREAGYFDLPSATKPLLHTWSLGVEEQFYLLWPFVLWLSFRRGLNLLFVTMAVGAASMLFNLVWTRHDPSGAFYLPHTRLWQLLAGGAVAAMTCAYPGAVREVIGRIVFASGSDRDSRLVANTASWIGLAMIATAIVGLTSGQAAANWWSGGAIGTFVQYATEMIGLSRQAPYPGWSAVPVTVGSLLLIAAGRDAWLNRVILANPVLVFVGLISYPLYLWHWPLLSFLQITEQGAPGPGLKLGAIALSFALASLTYVALERPIRRAVSRQTRGRLVTLAATLALVTLAAFVAYRFELLSPRVPRMAASVADDYPRRVNDTRCRERFPDAGEFCNEFSASRNLTTAILGDSHAAHLFPGLGAALDAHGENLVHLGQSGCPPLFEIERVGYTDNDRCDGVNRRVLEAVGTDPGITHVVLSFRGAAQVSGTGFGSVDGQLRTRYRLLGSDVGNADAIRRALAETVDYLLARRKDVWIALQIPELGFSPMECVGRPASVSHRATRTPCVTDKAAVLERQSEYRSIVAAVQRERPAVKVFDPLPYLCDDRVCRAMTDDQMLYSDSNHLTLTGSRLLGEKLALQLTGLEAGHGGR